jgi:hypothetical protein
MGKTTRSASKGNVLPFDGDDNDFNFDTLLDAEPADLLTFEQRLALRRVSLAEDRLEVEEERLQLEQRRFTNELANAAREATDRLLQTEMIAGIVKSALPLLIPLLPQLSGGSKEIEEVARGVIATIAQDLPDLKITKEKIERRARDRKAKSRVAFN